MQVHAAWLQCVHQLVRLEPLAYRVIEDVVDEVSDILAEPDLAHEVSLVLCFAPC